MPRGGSRPGAYITLPFNDNKTMPAFVAEPASPALSSADPVVQRGGCTAGGACCRHGLTIAPPVQLGAASIGSVCA